MGTLPEPDDVDFVVAGGDPDPDSHQKTIEFIEEYKSRPGYAEEVARARAYFESLKAKGHVPPDPDALLAQWQRYAEELKRRGVNGSPESAIGHEANEGR